MMIRLPVNFVVCKRIKEIYADRRRDVCVGYEAKWRDSKHCI